MRPHSGGDCRDSEQSDSCANNDANDPADHRKHNRLDQELTRRGELFRKAGGSQNLEMYRETPNPQIIPRTPSRTVPPEPQRFLRPVASTSMSLGPRAKPVTVVTPFPARPLTSLPTRTLAPGLAAPGAPLGQTQSLTALRQLGHKLPMPVE